MTASYVPLWCKSNYSFLEGASHPDELVEEAHDLLDGSLMHVLRLHDLEEQTHVQRHRGDGR